MQLFYEVAERERRHQRADFIDDLRLAFGGKQNDVTKVLRALRKP